MRKIKFDNLQSNWFFISLIVVSLLCIIFGFFEIIAFENPEINRRIGAVGYLAQVIFYSRMFWYKNYVQYNKKGLVIRIKSFLGKSISFEEITKLKFENKVLTIYKRQGIKHNFDLSDIEEEDSKKLFAIISKYYNSNDVLSYRI